MLKGYRAPFIPWGFTHTIRKLNTKINNLFIDSLRLITLIYKEIQIQQPMMIPNMNEMCILAHHSSTKGITKKYAFNRFFTTKK